MKAINREENERTRTGRAEIKVNGKNLEKDLDATVQKVVVEAELNMPTMFSFSLSIGSGAQTDGAVHEINDRFFSKFKPGTSVEIKMSRGSVENTLVQGIITALEPRFGQSPTVEIRGFDSLYLLRFGTHLRTFDDITDNDLAGELIEGTDLDLDMTATSTTHEYLLQNNQSHYDFLRERAERLGFEMRVEGKKLIIKKPDETAQEVLTLMLGEDLDEFSASMKIPTRGKEVEMRGMDLREAAGIDFTAPVSAAPSSGKKKNGFGYAVAPFPESTIAVVDEPLEDATDAETLAEARRDRELRDFVTGDGSAQGQPKLTIGRLIKLDGLGPRFNGKYYVTAATHTLDQGGYRTSFKVRRRKI